MRRSAAATAMPLLAAALLLLLSSLLISAQPTTLVPLDDENFEHQTQAATGQTTGHWFVLFVNGAASDDGGAAKLAVEAWRKVAADEEKGFIAAVVSTAVSPKTAKRFGLDADGSTPAALLFRERLVYRMPLSRSELADTDALAKAAIAFADAGGYEETHAAAVAGEESPLMSALNAAKEMVQLHPDTLLWTGVATMGLGLLIFLGLLAVGLRFMASPSAAAGPAPTPAKAAARKPAAKAKAAAAADDDDDDDDDRPAATGGRSLRRRA